MDCGFWKSEKEDFYVFCNLDNNIPAGNYTLDFSGISKFNYQNYNIILEVNKIFLIEKNNNNYLDLYSDNQVINIEEGKELYDLKFKVVSYNNEFIFLGSFISLDCKQNKDELICSVSKSD